MSTLAQQGCAVTDPLSASSCRKNKPVRTTGEAKLHTQTPAAGCLPPSAGPGHSTRHESLTQLRSATRTFQQKSRSNPGSPKQACSGHSPPGPPEQACSGHSPSARVTSHNCPLKEAECKASNPRHLQGEEQGDTPGDTQPTEVVGAHQS